MSAPGLLERKAGPYLFDVAVNGVVIPPGALGPIRIRHGREAPGIDNRPAPGTCTVQIAVDEAALPALPDIGDPLTVDIGRSLALYLLGLVHDVTRWNEVPPQQTWSATDPGVTWNPYADAADLFRRRFTGRVSDAVLTPAGPLTGPAVLTLTAVTGRSRLNRLRTAVDGGVWLSGGVPPGLIARDMLQDYAGDFALAEFGMAGAIQWMEPANQPVGAVLDSLAVQTSGELVELRDGRLSWQDESYRFASRTAALTLTAAEVLTGVESRLDLDGLVNDLRVQWYHPNPGQAGQQSVTATDPASISRHGPLTATIETALEQAPAQALAYRIVAAYGSPRWRMTGLGVDLIRTVGIGRARALLALEFGAKLAVTGFPSSGPFQATALYLEGWTEQVTRNAWRLDLDVSDPIFTQRA